MFRNIRWPYSRAHAERLANDIERIEELDTYLYSILIDGESNAKKMEEEHAKVYPIFYDETKEVSKMLKQEIKVKKGGRMPALLIVDKKSIVQYAYYGDSMKDIPENDVLFEILEKINK